jgi:hypothetical protein
VRQLVLAILKEAVTRAFGAGAWSAVRTPGTSDARSLPDVLAALPFPPGTPEDDRLRWFGRVSVGLLASRHPEAFAPHDSAESFLLALGDLLRDDPDDAAPGADLPALHFDVEDAWGRRILLAYRSRHRMCALAEGFVIGAAEHFGERVHIEQRRCMLRGAHRCDLFCTFESAA